MKKLISYVVPIYNEEKTIDKLYETLSGIFSQIEEKYDIELILVNDGSKDASLERLIELHEKDNRIKVINFSRNFGHEMAVAAGLDFAQGDGVIMMDADLQDPPEVSLELIKKWEEGYEVVYAQRRTRKDDAFKNWTAFIFYRLLNTLSDVKIPKDTGNYRIMDKKVVAVINKLRERNRYIRGLVSYVGFKQTAVLFDRAERFAGETHYPFTKMLGLAINAITSFSTVPLKFITQFGVLMSIFSFLLGVYAIIARFFLSNYVSGFATLLIAISFLGGVQMVMLGILGTYVGRIYSEVQGRPLYVVSSVYSKEKSKK